MKHSVRETRVEAPSPKSPWQLLLESTDDDCRELVKVLMAKSPKLKAAALSSVTLSGVAKRMMGPSGLGLLGEDVASLVADRMLVAESASSSALPPPPGAIGGAIGGGDLPSAAALTEGLEALGKEAAENVGRMSEQSEAADRFIKGHASVLKQLLDAGGKVDQALEDELLGVTHRERMAQVTIFRF